MTCSDCGSEKMYITDVEKDKDGVTIKTVWECPDCPKKVTV